jgi:integrase
MSNPAAKLTPATRQEAEQRTVDSALIDRIIDAQPLGDRVAVQLVLRAGLQKKELRYLRWGDLDTDAHELSVRGRGGKLFTVSVSDARLFVDIESLHDSVQPGPRHFVVPPRSRSRKPFTDSGMHRHWEICLARVRGSVHLPMRDAARAASAVRRSTS